MSYANQVVFVQGDERFMRSGASRKLVSVAGLGGPLPYGMRATYEVEQSYQRISVFVTLQARSKHGRRYFSFSGVDAESQAQGRILKWAARVLKERAKEGS